MLTQQERQTLIEKMHTLPDRLAALVKDLDTDALTTAYIPAEWTVAQNIHHLADAQMNAFIRFKLILMEHDPVLKTWQQNDWAEMIDSTSPEVEDSLAILRGVHARWVRVMRGLPAAEDAIWQRAGQHPEQGAITLDDLLGYYGEHGEVHIEQIKKTLAAR